MTNEEAEKGIENLEFTKAMFLFDPYTGKDKIYEMLNEDDKATYDGCVAGIEALEKQIPKRTIFNTKSFHCCPNCWKSGKYKNVFDCLLDKGTDYCYRCGQAIDWTEEVEDDRKTNYIL